MADGLPSTLMKLVLAVALIGALFPAVSPTTDTVSFEPATDFVNQWVGIGVASGNTISF